MSIKTDMITLNHLPSLFKPLHDGCIRLTLINVIFFGKLFGLSDNSTGKLLVRHMLHVAHERAVITSLGTTSITKAQSSRARCKGPAAQDVVNLAEGLAAPMAVRDMSRWAIGTKFKTSMIKWSSNKSGFIITIKTFIIVRCRPMQP